MRTLDNIAAFVLKNGPSVTQSVPRHPPASNKAATISAPVSDVQYIGPHEAICVAVGADAVAAEGGIDLTALRARGDRGAIRSTTPLPTAPSSTRCGTIFGRDMPLIELDAAINDPWFADACVTAPLENMRKPVEAR